jgi:hypothetical protein
VLVWVFLALVYFTLEFTHAHLMEPHSLTARPTQVSLCTCLCQKKVYCLFTQTMSSLTFFLETLSKILIKFSPAQPRSHLGWWSLFCLDLVIFSFANHVVALSSESPDPLLTLPRYLVIYYNLFSSIRCWSCLNLSFLIILILFL